MSEGQRGEGTGVNIITSRKYYNYYPNINKNDVGLIE